MYAIRVGTVTLKSERPITTEDRAKAAAYLETKHDVILHGAVNGVKIILEFSTDDKTN